MTQESAGGIVLNKGISLNKEESAAIPARQDAFEA